jgi:hypothetical protein
MNKVFLVYSIVNAKENEIVPWLIEFAGKEYAYRNYGPTLLNFKRSEARWCAFWIKKNVYEESGYEFWFKDKNIAILFKLTWGGNV